MVWTRSSFFPCCGVWRWTANRSTGQELPQLQLCSAISEREHWTQTRDQEDQAENSVVFLLLTSFRATPVLRGHLGRGDKELTFSKGKRGERQMDRGRGRGETDGWRGKGEVREKAVSSAEAKAVLQIQTHLLSYKVKWKGQECEPCLLNEKQNCSNGLVFTICTKHTESQCHRYIQNTQPYLKNRNRWEHGYTHWSLGGITGLTVTFLVRVSG